MNSFLKNKYILFTIQFLVATAITVTGYYAMPKIKHRYKIYQDIDVIEDFVGVLKRYQEQHQAFSGINNYIIKKDYRDLLDSRFIFHADNNIEHSTGGYFLISSGPANYNSNRYDSLILSYVNLGSDRCIDLATYDWTKLKTARVIGVMASSVSRDMDFNTMYWGCNGSSVIDNYTTACPKGKYYSIPMSEEAALTACRCYNNYCSVTLKLY